MDGLVEHSLDADNPFFIAMGTTIRDFLAPEFVLFGMRNPEAAATARELYRTLHDQPLYETSIENAVPRHTFARMTATVRAPSVGGSPESPKLVSQFKYDLDALYARVEQYWGLSARGTHTAWRHGKYAPASRIAARTWASLFARECGASGARCS